MLNPFLVCELCKSASGIWPSGYIMQTSDIRHWIYECILMVALLLIIDLIEPDEFMISKVQHWYCLCVHLRRKPEVWKRKRSKEN